MRELSDELDDLSKLDELRKQARKLRNEGMNALGRIQKNSPPSWNGRPTGRPDATRKQRDTPDTVQVEGPPTLPKWHGSGGKIEAAMLARVQCKHHPERNGHGSALIDELLSISIIEDLLQLPRIEPEEDPAAAPSAAEESVDEGTETRSPSKRGPRSDVDEVPVLLAARAMQALVPSAQHTFSRATMLCYYRIIREICIADSPDWNAGGARAGVGGEVTAYVTAECIRAVLMLERSIRGTADFLRATDKFYRYALFLKNVQGTFLAKWREVEAERAALDWYITMLQQRPYLALNLPLPDLDKSGKDRPDQRFTLEEMLIYFDDLGKSIQKGLETSVVEFERAAEKIQEARELEEKLAKSPRKRGDDARRSESADTAARGATTVTLGETSERLDSRYVRSMSAHAIAAGVIATAVHDANLMVGDCKSKDGTLKNLHRLASRFEAIARQVRTLLDPAERYIASVLDHELTAASQEKPVWDARELAFAAGAYGALTQWRTDERLNRAATLLSNDISPSGLFRLGKPFHTVPSGLRWQPLHFEVCRAFSELMANVDVAVNPALIRQMLSPFDKMSIELKVEENPQVPRTLLSNDHEREETKLRGWHMEDPPIPMRPTLWVSGHATLALDKLVRMLDQKINKIILDYFTYKQPEAIEFKLENLFYPDYGRDLFYRHDPNGPASDEKAASESIGITLQRMRAHIVDAKLPGAYAGPVFSSVLHGPPGTGKTTLLEALAKSSGSPLVEMSPSDIAMKGEQAIEARARATFQALAMLTHVVIIFDEFEPVLQERGAREDSTESRNVYTFLTPGMLPKLTRLHDEARHKRTAYTLVTNHLHKLDKAAIRPGRFDRHVGIYMPDPVSRAGYFMKVLSSSIDKETCNGPITRGPEGLFVLTDDQRERFDLLIRKSGGIPPSRLVPRWFNVLNGVDDAFGGGDYVLSGHDWKLLPEEKIPHPGDKEYTQLYLLEEHRLNAWEWLVRSTSETNSALGDLLVAPGDLIDQKDEEFRQTAADLAKAEAERKQAAEFQWAAKMKQDEEAQKKAEQQTAEHGGS